MARVGVRNLVLLLVILSVVVHQTEARRKTTKTLHGGHKSRTKGQTSIDASNINVPRFTGKATLKERMDAFQQLYDGKTRQDGSYEVKVINVKSVKNPDQEDEHNFARLGKKPEETMLSTTLRINPTYHKSGDSFTFFIAAGDNVPFGARACLDVVVDYTARTSHIEWLHASHGPGGACPYKGEALFDIYHKLIVPFFNIKRTSLDDSASFQCGSGRITSWMWMSLLGLEGLYERRGYRADYTKPPCRSGLEDMKTLKCVSVDWVGKAFKSVEGDKDTVEALYSTIPSTLKEIVPSLPKRSGPVESKSPLCQGEKAVKDLLLKLQDDGLAAKTRDDYEFNCKRLTQLMSFLRNDDDMDTTLKVPMRICRNKFNNHYQD